MTLTNQMKFRLAVGKGDDFCRTDEGEVQRVEEEDDPLLVSLVGLQRYLSDAQMMMMMSYALKIRY